MVGPRFLERSRSPARGLWNRHLTYKLLFDRSFFSRDDKLAYIDAVLCLQSKPGRTPRHLAPGVRSRYDDFVATHINQTMQIHYSVRLL